MYLGETPLTHAIPKMGAAGHPKGLNLPLKRCQVCLLVRAPGFLNKLIQGIHSSVIENTRFEPFSGSIV